MNLLLDGAALQTRGAVARQNHGELLTSLANELRDAFVREPVVPVAKARLTRAGGRCPVDSFPLIFDPFSAHVHRCPRCGATYTDREHELWWNMSQQLFLAERTVHGALLHKFTGDESFRRGAHRLLAAWCDLYLTYPAADSVLGPSRPFFSTYLESIWLLQICIATDLLSAGEQSGELARAAAKLRARVVDRIVEPSAALIASYDESGSNRQVWNDVALLAAYRLMGRGADAEERATRLAATMQRSLLKDGSWYEGENYHLFAHRGLWYARVICDRMGYALPDDALRRYRLGFFTPFRSMLPDMTLLSRRDSQYAISVRQWRFAESCELGLAELSESGEVELENDLASVLAMIYRRDADRSELSDYPTSTSSVLRAASGLHEERPEVRPPADAGPVVDRGRANSTAEAERNVPASLLTRADLGWKSLLFALPQLPAPSVGDSALRRSCVLADQGLAVLRDASGAAVATLDYGHQGGGHGHPDRLNVTLYASGQRWLDDFGTGSYVDQSLFWYRSSLAHNAPMADWQIQTRNDGSLVGYADEREMSLVEGEFRDAATGTAYNRFIALTSDFMVDVLGWRADGAARIQLPIHLTPHALRTPGNEGWVDLRQVALSAHPWDESPGPDGGVGYVSDVRTFVLPARELLRLQSRVRDHDLESWMLLEHGSFVHSMIAPGPPLHDRRELIVVDMPANAEFCVLLYSWKEGIALRRGPDMEFTVSGASNGDLHFIRTADAWTVRIGAEDGDAPVARMLRRSPAISRHQPHAAVQMPRGPITVITPGQLDDALHNPKVEHSGSAQFHLADSAFRRSDLDWRAHGKPEAVVTVAADENDLAVLVSVRAGQRNFAPARAAPHLDNENPDINSDGVQIHLMNPDDTSGTINNLIFVPETHGRARISSNVPGFRMNGLRAAWQPTSDGYQMEIRIPRGNLGARGSAVFLMDVVVNLLANGRERRSGQLLMSGGHDDWIYLRGDRQSPQYLLPFRITDV